MGTEKSTETVETVEINDVNDEQSQEQETDAIVEQKERELAIKHGLIEKEDAEKEKKETDSDGDEVEIEKKETEKPTEPTFEQMDEDLSNRPDEFHKKYDSNSKALYFKQKKYKQRAQEAETEKEHLLIKNKALQKELDDLKKGPEETDVENEHEEQPLTRSELDKIAQEKIAEQTEKQNAIAERAKKIKENLDLQLAEAKSQFTDFDEVIGLAQEVIKNGLLPKDFPVSAEELQKKYTEKIINMDEDIAVFAYRIGKLHPDFGKAKGTTEIKEVTEVKTNKKDIEKIIANADKPKSSANIGGGAGATRKISIDDITVEDAAKLSTDEWRKLPRNVRDRLLAS